MVDGVRLTLMIGPAVPLPVPREVLEALTSVQVTSTTEGPSGFQLTFELPSRSPLHTLFLLSGGASIPIVRVLVVATVRGVPEVLMDGVMTHHEVGPASEAGRSTFTVTGEDLSRVMDYLDFSGMPYPAMPLEARVALILAKYAGFGIVPVVIPSVLVDVPMPTDRIPAQRGKDLAYIRQLAEEAGYVFYVEPGPAPGTSLAYWGPELKVGVPQRALNVDLDAHRNVKSISFRYDAESARLPVVYVQEPSTRAPIPIPIPDVSLLNPPLGLVPPIPKQVEPLEGTARLSPVRAALAGLARAARTADGVSASGSLDVVRYGAVLRPRRLVGVRGAGPAFDGLYFVKSVTHSLRRGEYTQDFTLSRNGLLSTLPVVPV